MRLLNIDTYRLESFQNADNAPSYAIFSHRWGNEEVVFDDLQEPLINQDFRVLQLRLEQMERRFDGLMCRLEKKDPKEAQAQHLDQDGKLTSQHTYPLNDIEPLPLSRYKESKSLDYWGHQDGLQATTTSSESPAPIRKLGRRNTSNSLDRREIHQFFGGFIPTSC